MSIRLFDEDGNTEKTGIISHRISWKVDTLAECVGAIPNPVGLPENWGKRRWKKWADGGFILNATYEGVFENLTNDPTKADVGFYPSFKEAKLPTNPNFQALLTKYGGTYDPFTGVITWQNTLSGGGGGGFAGGNSTGSVNPLFGQDSYIELAVIFRRTRVSSSPPLSALTSFAQIKASLPAEAEGIPTPTDRNWFVMPPTLERRGSVWTYTDEWLLSPPGQKWSKDIYNFISA